MIPEPFKESGFKITAFEIEGCFTVMPPDAIRTASKDVVIADRRYP